jgi:NAD(P)-dependent dehydrogenase (short-subunit alcohol dehydrogenase family)
MKLANKVALITGAGSGQGRAASLLFAGEGAAIAAVDIDGESAIATANEIEARGGRAFGMRADVSKEADAERMVAAAIERFGQLDILYNNAGIEGDVSADLFDLDNYDRVMGVNLRGAVLGMKYAIPHMVKRGSGAVINTSSIAAIMGFPGGMPYAASKAGIVALTRVAGMVYAPHNIRINCILPGPIDTPMWRRTIGAGGEARPAMDPVSPLGGRAGTPEEIAKMALFLASDDASFAVARPFVIDGAWTTGLNH